MPTRGMMFNSQAACWENLCGNKRQRPGLNSMSYQVRDVDPASVSTIHAMNEDALPHVNSMPPAYFRAQVDRDSYFRAVYAGGRPVAFLLAMNEAADYDSLNFLWFREHYDRFIYIDRVVVDPAHHRRGHGLALYEDLVQWSSGRTPRLACEVNIRPPNEPSMRFHQSQGFMPVGTQDTDGGRKTVSLMVREFDGS